jgi:class 3 adenylate cyclase
MERDEVSTLATLTSHRSIIDDLVAAHNGRITGTAGDSVLAEFPSVVDALDCAVKMQDAIAAANESRPAEERLLFRIGINVGDVMLKDGDIFGDGVNVAARLETLAEPGGICVSRGVRDHVRKMGCYAFQDLGEQSVKNIAQPIRALRARAERSTSPKSRATRPRPKRWRGRPNAMTRRSSSSLSGRRSRTPGIQPSWRPIWSSIRGRLHRLGRSPPPSAGRGAASTR